MGLLDRLLRRWESKGEAEPALSKEDVVRIVRDYSVVLASGTPGPSCVADVRLLPHPKAHIRKALIVAMQASRDQKTRAALINAYHSLSEYQEGVGDRVLGIDPTKLDMRTSVEDQASAIRAQSMEMEKWVPVVKAEFDVLVADLKRLSLS